MAPHALDVLGYLPRPAKNPPEGVFKLFNAEYLAYASGPTICIVSIQCMRTAAVLVSAPSAPVTAIEWHPTPLSGTSTPLLASGDADGRIVIWDVNAAAPMAVLEDAYWAGFGSNDGERSRRGDAPRVPVRALAWATARDLLAVLLSPGYLVLWDCKSGGVVWRKDLGSSDAYSSMQTDPCDRRKLLLSTASGAFLALRLDAPSADRVEFSQRFQAEISSGTLNCLLPGTPDLVVLLLQRELMIFDIELGLPAASTPLPAGLPNFAIALASFGHQRAGIAPHEAGIDVVYCAHVDGSVSTWHRKEDSLSYSLSAHLGLSLSPQGAGLRGPSGGGGASGPPQIIAVAAAAWRGLRTRSPFDDDGRYHHYHTTTTAAAADGLKRGSGIGAGGGMMKTHVIGDITTAASVAGSGAAPGRIRLLRRIADAGTGTAPGNLHDTARRGGGAPRQRWSVLAVAMATDGSLSQWQLPLLMGTFPPSTTISRSHGSKSVSAAEKPQPAAAADDVDKATPATFSANKEKEIDQGDSHPLYGDDIDDDVKHGHVLGAHHSLSSSATCMAVFPRLIVVPGCFSGQHDGAYATTVASSTKPHTPAGSSNAPSSDAHQQRLAAASCSSFSGSNRKQAAIIVAIGSAEGAIELATLQQGPLMPVHMEISASFAAVHSAPVQGISWLGNLPLLVSFSTQRASSSNSASTTNEQNQNAYKNRICVTDALSGASVSIREGVACDPGPLTAVRPSPSGNMLLLVFQGMPAELWTVASSLGQSSTRLRQIDLQFSAVEWGQRASQRLRSDAGMSADVDVVVGWGGATQVKAKQAKLADAGNLASTSGAADAHGMPSSESEAEALVFALADGRVGVLSIEGRKITDTRPHVPSWGPLAAGDFSAGATASWGDIVLLGGTEGTLVAWNIRTGRTTATDLGCGRIYRLNVISTTQRDTPAPADTTRSQEEASHARSNHANSSIATARVAVLAISGAFSVYNLDANGQLRQTTLTRNATAARLGRALDVAFAPLPPSLHGAGTLVLAALENGSVAALHAPRTGSKPLVSAARRCLSFETLGGAGGDGGRSRSRSSSLAGVDPQSAAISHATTPDTVNTGECSTIETQPEQPPPQPATPMEWELASAPSLLSAACLPRTLSRVLRVLIQCGTPLGLLESAVSVSAASLTSPRAAAFASEALGRLENELWARLPKGAREETAAHVHGSTPREGIPAMASGGGSGGSGGGEQASSPSFDSESTAMADLLASAAASGTPSSPLGSPNAAHAAEMEEIATRLGYRPPSAARAGSQALKSLGGAFKDMAMDVASAGKDRVGRRLSRGGDGDWSLSPSKGIGSDTPRVTSEPRAVEFALSPRRSEFERAHSAVRGLGTATSRGGGGAAGAGGLSGENEARPTLVGALRACATLRGLYSPLSVSEMAVYETVVSPSSSARGEVVVGGGIAGRMAVAASLLDGTIEEIRFWQRLPATLAALKRERDETIDATRSNTAPRHHKSALLWSAATEVSAAEERSKWHAQLDRRALESSEMLQERRILELVALRDLQAAVGLLLACPPARSARFYRDALCTLGMAFACGMQASMSTSGGGGMHSTSNTGSEAAAGGAAAGDGGGSNPVPAPLGGAPPQDGARQSQGRKTDASDGDATKNLMDAAARSLFVQATKVIVANAASFGDSLLGVPLLCCTGDYADAVSILQDADLWCSAAALTASSLRGTSRAAPLERWASHMAAAEGRTWQACGVLVGSDQISAAVDVLLQGGAPDAAAALLEAAEEAGVGVFDNAKSQQLQQHSGTNGGGGGGAELALKAVVNKRFVAHIQSLLKAL